MTVHLRATVNSTLPGTAATTKSVVIPASAQNGDLLIMFVQARSAVTTLAGWTLIDSQAFTSSSTTQTLYAYYKVCSGDAGTTVTFTQASSVTQMMLHCQVWQPASGGGVIGTPVAKAHQTGTTAQLTASYNTATGADGIILWGFSTIGLTNPATWVLDSITGADTKFTTPNAVNDQRLAAAYMLDDKGTHSDYGRITQGSNPAATNGMAMLIIFVPATVDPFNNTITEVYGESFAQYPDKAIAKITEVYGEIFHRLPPTTKAEISEVFTEAFSTYPDKAIVKMTEVYVEVLRSRRVRRTPIISISETII